MGAAFLLALVSAGAVAMWEAREAAQQARRAERRFSDVRELAHSSLFEFHDAIRDLPGSVPARRLLVTRALVYLGRLAQDTEGDASLRRELVAAYIQVGHVQGRPNWPNLGDTAGALASYRAAVALAETLPADDASAAARMEAWDVLGNLLATMGAPRREALGLLRRALQARREQVARHPDNPEARRGLAISLASLGDALHARDVPAADRLEETMQAEKLYLESVPVRERLHAENPDNEWDTIRLASIYYRLGNTALVFARADEGRRDVLEKGMEYHRRSIALREESLAAHPTSGLSRRALADGLEMKSELQTRLGDPAGALADCRRAAELLAPLVAADPQDVWVRQDLAHTYYSTVIAQRGLGDLPGAIASVDRAGAIYEALAAADPTSLLAVERLNTVLRLRTELCREHGDAAEAQASARRWVQCAERLAAASPGDEARRSDLAHARAALPEPDGT